MAFEQLGQAVPVEERELGWDDTIEKESAGFIILPEGDYEFKVLEFQRARHEGSEKLPPCNKAVITLVVETPEGEADKRTSNNPVPISLMASLFISLHFPTP